MLCFSKQQVEKFKQCGFVVAPALADEDVVAQLQSQVAAQRAALPMELEAEVGYPGAPVSEQAPGGSTPRRLLQAWQRGGALAQWAAAPQVLSRVGQLLDSSTVYLSQAHHNCVMTKYPSYSSDTHWHQDVRYWSFANRELVNCWLALGREVQDNGGLRVISGSQRWVKSAQRLDPDLFLDPQLAINQAAIASAQAVDLEPGDALFFHAGLFHSASRNATDEVKVSVVFSYHGSANRPQPGSRSALLPEIEFKLR